MIDTFFVHEKCDNDVIQILEELKKSNHTRVEKFRYQLIEVYQAIFENSYIAEEVYRKWELHNEEIRGLMLPSFPYGVIYKRLPERKVVILGVVFVNRHFRYSQFLNN